MTRPAVSSTNEPLAFSGLAPDPSRASALNRCPEADVLLWCARTRLDSEGAERINTLLSTRVDWATLLWQASRHGMLPLLYWHLSTLCPDAVPEAIFKQLQGHYHNTLRVNLSLTHELLALLGLFEAHGIMVLSYKGPVLAASLYRHLGLREFNALGFPLGLLVRRQDFPRAKELLSRLGYRPQIPLTHAQEAAYLQTRHGYLFGRDDGVAAVELHWGITSQGFLRPLTVESLWDHRERFVLEGRTVCTLSPEDLLLILCAHGADHLWVQLAWVCDVAELIRVHEEMDWQRVLEQARRLGVERMLLLGLELASELLSTELSVEVRQRMPGDPMVKALATQMQRRLFHGTRASIGSWERRLFHLRMRERLRDRVKYGLDRVLTPTLDDWTFLPLPASLSFLYALIRPFRLIHKYSRDRVKRLLHVPSHVVPFFPTPPDVIERMLALAEVKPTDVVYDLGCGDGRIVIAAARRYGTRGVGVDLDPECIREATVRARQEGVDHLVTFVQQDAMKVDVSPATVVTLCLSPSWNLTLLPKLNAQLRQHARIVSLSSDMGTWSPLKAELVTHADGVTYILYLWQIGSGDGDAS